MLIHNSLNNTGHCLNLHSYSIFELFFNAEVPSVLFISPILGFIDSLLLALVVFHQVYFLTTCTLNSDACNRGHCAPYCFFPLCIC